MTCNHDKLKEYGKRELREELLKGTDSMTCPDCGAEFELQQNNFDGKVLLVKQGTID